VVILTEFNGTLNLGARAGVIQQCREANPNLEQITNNILAVNKRLQTLVKREHGSNSARKRGETWDLVANFFGYETPDVGDLIYIQRRNTNSLFMKVHFLMMDAGILGYKLYTENCDLLGKLKKQIPDYEEIKQLCEPAEVMVAQLKEQFEKLSPTDEDYFSVRAGLSAHSRSLRKTKQKMYEQASNINRTRARIEYLEASQVQTEYREYYFDSLWNILYSLLDHMSDVEKIFKSFSSQQQFLANAEPCLEGITSFMQQISSLISGGTEFAASLLAEPANYKPITAETQENANSAARTQQSYYKDGMRSAVAQADQYLATGWQIE